MRRYFLSEDAGEREITRSEYEARRRAERRLVFERGGADALRGFDLAVGAEESS